MTTPPPISSLLGQQKLQGVSSPVAPSFREEGPSHYTAAYNQNRQFAKPGSYTTRLNPVQESMFQKWVASNRVPFDPHAKISDYDMRGYWKQTGGSNWRPGQHFPDTFKTPYDTTFSRESKYATPNNPYMWLGNKLIDSRSGRVVFG